MFSFIWMKILESSPSRYDKGIRLLTLGLVDKAYDRMVSGIDEKDRILDIGCGTGTLTLKAARKGAFVKGIDMNPAMLDIALSKAVSQGLEKQVTFNESGVTELDGEEENTYDVVMSGLCFSELTDEEIDFSLIHILRILKPGGRLLIADEVRPGYFFPSLLYRIIRLPLALITYLFTQTVTHPVKNLPGRILGKGFTLISIRTFFLGSLMEIQVGKPKGRML